MVTPEQRARVAALAQDFPRLWNAPTTQAKDKKRILRLLINAEGKPFVWTRTTDETLAQHRSVRPAHDNLNQTPQHMSRTLGQDTS